MPDKGELGEPKELLERLQRLAEMQGVDYIGVAGLGGHYSELRKIGGELLDEYPRAVSIGIVLPQSIVDLLKDRESYENAFQYRTHAYDIINNRLDIFASIIGSVIQRNGYKAMPLPAAERIDSARICASISHKATARLAGFGWIGKNCLLITPEHGPRVRWTTVLTDAPFRENETAMETRCGSCEQCAKACPVQALKRRNYIDGEPREERFDVFRCEAYYQEMERAGKLKVCGMCLYACPYGR